ncbi:MAG TPA: hypothetical protein VIQ30_05415 [Pseudonocardia sp.]
MSGTVGQMDYLGPETDDERAERLDPERNQKARRVVARYAKTQDDTVSVARELLDMLGLRGEEAR